MKQRYLFMKILAAGMIICTGLVMGCGKKGAPLPPLDTVPAIAAPVNLTHTLDGSLVILNWTLEKAGEAPVDGFEVFAATKEKAGCQGCPFIFKSQGRVPMPKMTFSRELEPDLDYYFRVQALDENGVKSRFSKTLYIDRK